jgi:NTE family protein
LSSDWCAANVNSVLCGEEVSARSETTMTTRALVLSGGGPVGIAWETGLLAGLYGAGIDVGRADLVIGTSAGSAVGALLALGRTPLDMAERLERQIDGGNVRARNDAAQSVPTDLTRLMAAMDEMYRGGAEREAAVRDVLRLAVETKTISEDAFIATFGRQIADATWPAKRYMCTTMAVDDGSVVVWDATSGVPLARAVASSCSVPGIYPPITIHGKRFTDGPRSITSAQLAAGHDRVLIALVRISLEQDTASSRAAAAQLDAEVAAIEAAGGTARVISPDAAAERAFGVDLMNFRLRGLALDAGLRQGGNVGRELAEFWN